MLSFNGTEQRSGAEAGGSTAENGSEVASIASGFLSHQAVRGRARFPFKPLRRRGLGRTPRTFTARRRAAIWRSPEALQVELSRSRRFGHTFFLARIACSSKEDEGSCPLNELAHAVSSLLRRVDSVWLHETSLYLLLPEGDRAMGEAMLARIRAPLAELFSEGEVLSIPSVVFPQDGVTIGALLGALEDTVPLRPDPVPALSPMHESPAA